VKNDDHIVPSDNYCDGLVRCILYCILFVFMLVLYCFCVAVEFSVNKDLYIGTGPVGRFPSNFARRRVKASPYSTTERRIPELIPVPGSQPAGDVSHKTGGRLPLLSARPAVTLATLKRAATNFAAW